MRKVIFAFIVFGAMAMLGLVAAFGAGLLLRQSGFAQGAGMMGRYGGITGGYGPGMMGGNGMMGGWNGVPSSGQRLTMERITIIAGQYAAQYGGSLEVAEVMEFSNNFYAVLREKETGRGAMEILLDPVTGAVSPEMGPNMMWNALYGHMGGGVVYENLLSLEQARALAQKALDESQPGAKVHADGWSFYGYYTFDYDVAGRTAGMLSVHGSNGAVWFHTWHGQFIAEKEIIQ